MTAIKSSLFFYIYLLLSFALTACSVFSPVKAEPTTTYIINNVPSVASFRSRYPVSVLVNQTQASSIYNTTSIAYSARPYEISYFVKSRWIDTPAQMINPLIIKTLEKMGRFRYVNSFGAYGPYDYTLNTTLVKLQEDFTHHPYTVHLVMRAQLVKNSDNRIMGAREFSVVEPLRDNTPYGGVVATNRATAILLNELAHFTLSKTRA